MKRYYKVVDGCGKCSRKRVFAIDESQAPNWSCPFDTEGCCGKLVNSSVIEKYLSAVVKAGIALLVFFLVCILFRQDEGDKLEDRLEKAHKEAQSFGSEVRKLPQNTGPNDPYKDRWIIKYDNRAKRLESLIPSVKENLEKLRELEAGISLELEQAATISVPDFTPTKPLKKYNDLKSEGRRLLSEHQSIKGQATNLQKKVIVARASRCERKLLEDLKELGRKSRPVGGGSAGASPNDILAAYKAKLQGATISVGVAIKAEIERRAKLAAEEEAQRLRELEEQRLKSLQQRIEDWNAAKPDFTINCSKALNKSLIEPLIRAYATRGGGVYMVLSDPHGGEDLRYVGSSYVIETSHAKGISSETVSVEVRDRATSKKNSKVIALDAMVVVTGSAAPISLVAGDLENIIAGKIETWTEVGGGGGAIQVLAPISDTGDHATMGQDIQALLERNSEVVLSGNVASAASANPLALGLCAFHNSSGFRRVAIRASRTSEEFTPSPSSISSENYRYSKRVYADLPENPSSQLRDFMSFVESGDGQKVVADCGFIDLRIELVSKPLDEFALPIIAKAFNIDVTQIVSAYRLNTNFRFAINSSDLDAKAKADIERVQQTLNIHIGTNKKALTVGFADSDGGNKENEELSINRAEQVYGFLSKEVDSKAALKYAGEGENFPIADNETEIGKSQNRRVEVWIVEIN